MEIVVCPLHLAPEIAKSKGVSHAISLLDPFNAFPSLHPLGDDAHLKIGIHDIDELIEGYEAPGAHHVQSALSFAKGWNRSAPILVHCWAGVSRSTATAFSIACAANPDASEIEIAQSLRAASPTASPNLRIVALADEILKRGGRMYAAAESIGKGNGLIGVKPFSIPAHYAPGNGGA
jgi:predicted protein tyrosine phosphatase